MSLKSVFVIKEGIPAGNIPGTGQNPKGPYTVVGYENGRVRQTKKFDDLMDADDQLQGYWHRYDDAKMFDADGNDITTSEFRDRYISF